MVIRSVRTLWLIVIAIATFVLLVGTIEVRGQVVTGTGLTIGPTPTPPQGSTVRITGIGTENGPVFADAEGDLLKRFLIRTDMPTGIAWLADNQTFTGLNTFNSIVTLPSMRSSQAQLPLTVRSSGNTTDLFMFSDSAAAALVPFISDLEATFNRSIDVSGISRLNGVTNNGPLNQFGLTTFDNDIRFTGSGRRIHGLFDGPTTSLGNRTSFVTTTLNGNTTIQAIPNGTGTATAFTAYNSSDPSNSSYVSILATQTQTWLYSAGWGTGSTTLPLGFHVGAEVARMNSNSDHMVLGSGQAGWRYLAASNISGQRWWREGLYGTNFGVWGGQDDGSTYAPLWHGTMSGGVPNGMYWGAGVIDVNPTKNYQTRLGTLTNKYLQLAAAELWVETLVAADTMATIGGRILVGPTTQLIIDLPPAATSIDVKHNNLVNGDRVYMEANGKVEFMAITSAATAITGGYRYSVTRTLDPTVADQWHAGDAVFNTGQAGNGFIDIYSTRGVRAGTEIGPSIVGNVRLSTTYNDWAPRWAVGNLAGIYGNGATPLYGAAFGNQAEVWTQYDSTYGMRGMDGTTQFLIVHPSGYIRTGNPSARNIYQDNAQIIMYENGSTPRMWFDTNGIRFYDTSGSSYYMNLGTTGSTFGYAMANFGNVHITNTGQLYMRNGTINRMLLEAYNGSMTWYRPDGLATMQIRSDVAQFGNVDTGARVQLSTSGIAMSKPDGNWFFNIDATNGILMGNWSVANKAYFQVTANGDEMYFCRAGVNCPLVFYGSTGNIASSGNIYLTGGGQVLSTNNFVLGNSTGLQFQRWDGGTYQASRSIQFLTGPGGTLMGEVGMEQTGALRLNSRSYGASTGIRMALGNLSYGGIEGGLFLTQQPDGTGGRWTNITAQSASEAFTNALVSFSPVKAPIAGAAVANATLGRTDSRWDNIYLNLPQSGNPPSYVVTGTTDGSFRYWNHGLGVATGFGIQVKNWAGANCYIYVAMGLTYYTDCGGAVLAADDPNGPQAVADRLNAERKARGENTLGEKGKPDVPLPRLEPRSAQQPAPVP